MTAFRNSSLSALLVIVLGVLATLAIPQWVDDFALIQITIYVVMAILAISQAFIWGFSGILCFGQASFFGLGAYTYALSVINLGESTWPVLLAIAIPGAFAMLLGYFMFYGRLSDVYMGVITLTVSLIFFNSVNSTAGPEYHVGKAPLGGFNGIPAIPGINMPGNPENTLDAVAFFYLSAFSLILIYAGLRWLIASRIGHVIVAIKENEQRATLLGFDARAYKLFAFTVGGCIAGLAGCYFANWGSFTSPTVFSLAQSAQIIVWVIVGGLGTLVGPIIGCMAIQWLTTQIGTQQTFNANLVLGFILTVFVLLVPKGIIPSLGDVLTLLFGRKPKQGEDA